MILSDIVNQKKKRKIYMNGEYLINWLCLYFYEYKKKKTNLRRNVSVLRNLSVPSKYRFSDSSEQRYSNSQNPRQRQTLCATKENLTASNRSNFRCCWK